MKIKEVTALSDVLSPTQVKVKKARRCIYSGNKQNTDPSLARDILTLYISCGLGYSPIRHLLGLKNDKKIEDVIRQHMLGRSNVDGSIGELYCPPSQINEVNAKIIVEIANKYGTLEDEYVHNMLLTGRWKDDPISKYPILCSCGAELDKSWKFCPYCNKRLKASKIKTIVNVG